MTTDGDDKDALFHALYAKHYTRVLRYFNRTAHLDYRDIEELTQDVFVRAYENWHLYRREAEWAYLEKIARNVLLNHVRRVGAIKRGGHVATKSIDDLTPSEQPAAPQELDYAARQERERRQQLLRAAIDGLTEGQREAVQLSARGLKYKEIAFTLRISVDAVKSRLRDAKRHLQKRLGQDVSGMLPEEEE